MSKKSQISLIRADLNIGFIMKNKINSFFESKKGKIYLDDFYGSDENIHKIQKKRYFDLTKKFHKVFKKDPMNICSTPGRTEIIGNHTDHNLGKVIAAGITLDSIAACSPVDGNIVRLYSGYYDKLYEVNIDKLEPIEKETKSANSLIRGVASGLNKKGYNIGGFDAYIESDVLPGSGLSSSASFEVLIGTIFNGLYNDNKVNNEELAKIGQYAENNFMKKPCGLMDQLACSLGGIITIDFKELKNPDIKKLKFDLKKHKYSIFVVDTGGSHENLTHHYALIPKEMKNIAAYYKKKYLRGINYNDLLNNIKKLRIKYGDRAILRAIHYFNENDKVKKLIEIINQDNIDDFLKIITLSGNSSWKILQNCYVGEETAEQGITLGLAVTENFINNIKSGACRVHGGGFAGTILTFIPDDFSEEYIKLMRNIFGKNSVKHINIRQTGTLMII